jgi:hypothetical protein
MAKRKRGRPRKDGPRDKNDRLIPAGKFTPPADHIVAKRKLWSFVTPTKGPDGRTGEIDQDVCDGIGQFCALGILDNPAVDPVVLRDVGREWRNLHLKLIAPVSMKTGGYERVSAGSAEKPLGLQRLNARDRDRYEKLDGALSGSARSALHMLLIEPEVGTWPLGQENVGWVQAVINEGLLKRGKVVPFLAMSMQDTFWKDEAIVGLFALYDASLPSRWERAA